MFCGFLNFSSVTVDFRQATVAAGAAMSTLAPMAAQAAEYVQASEFSLDLVSSVFFHPIFNFQNLP